MDFHLKIRPGVLWTHFEVLEIMIETIDWSIKHSRISGLKRGGPQDRGANPTIL